ncbi:hypothetical protein HMPREF9120_00734 [Neisseria sp. oral taxon 020 str. F0370]|nr:hypothetical protein HMPREF9120_00734 [Neisseria sp. oral taxon 020 str. F0370]
MLGSAKRPSEKGGRSKLMEKRLCAAGFGVPQNRPDLFSVFNGDFHGSANL